MSGTKEQPSGAPVERGYRDVVHTASGLAVKEDELLERAQLYIEDGIHGRYEYSEALHSQVWWYKVAHSPWFQSLYTLCVVVNMCLAIFERPSSSAKSPEAMIPPYITNTVELFCVAVYASDLALRYRFMSREYFWKNRWHRLRLVLIILMALNDITDYFVPFHVVARICRPFIFIDHFRNVRKIFAAILYAVPRISNVFVLLGVHILFFGIVANMFFAGVDGNNCAFFENNSTDSQVAPKPNSGYQDGYCSSFARNCLDYYRTPTDSMLNLFLLLTTVNCPDIFVPVYTCSRYAAIFFIIYLMIGLYFLLSLVMAVAYTHYQHQASEKAVHRVQKRTWALDKAFAILLDMEASSSSSSSSSSSRGARQRRGSRAVTRALSADPNETTEEFRAKLQRFMASHKPEELAIGFDTWVKLMGRLRPDLSAVESAVLFAAMDTHEPRGRLSANEFHQLHRYINVKVQCFSRHEERWGGKWRDPLRTVVEDKRFHRTMDVLVFLNTIQILAQFFDENLNNNTILDVVGKTLLGIFAVEISSGIVGMGPRKFFSDGFNRLDAFAVGAALATLPWQDGDDDKGDTSSQQFTELFTLIRMLRLFRALRLLRPFRVFFATATQIIPSVARYTTLLLCSYYFFAIIGMEAFAGRLSITDPRVRNSAYGKAEYWPLNFDSLGTSMVCLFALMVVNNFPILMEGYVAAVGDNARIYFIVHFVVTVIVLMNVLVAFVIDAYTTQYDETVEQQQNEGAAWDLRLQEVTQNHEHVRVWVPWARENGKLARTDEESNSSTENGVEMTLTAGAIASFQADGSVIEENQLPVKYRNVKWQFKRPTRLADLYEKLFEDVIAESGVSTKFLADGVLDSSAGSFKRKAARVVGLAASESRVAGSSSRRGGRSRVGASQLGLQSVYNPLSASTVVEEDVEDDTHGSTSTLEAKREST